MGIVIDHVLVPPPGEGRDFVLYLRSATGGNSCSSFPRRKSCRLQFHERRDRTAMYLTSGADIKKSQAISGQNNLLKLYRTLSRTVNF